MTTHEKTISLAQEAGLSVKFMTVAEIEALVRFYHLAIADYENKTQDLTTAYMFGYSEGKEDAAKAR